MKPYWDLVQGSPEWWELRRGRPTTSEFIRIISPAKCEFPASAYSYIAQLISERVSTIDPDNLPAWTSRSAEYGKATEEDARRSYALMTGNYVRKIGFCTTDDGRFGSSPDGIITNDPEEANYYSLGGLEIKCPEPKTHMSWVLGPGGKKARAQWEADNRLPLAHKCQVHGELLVTGLPYVEFYSYAPGCPDIRIKITRNEFTDKMRKNMDIFWELFQNELAKIECPS